MHRDPNLFRLLRNATREAAQDLDNLKIVRPENDSKAADVLKGVRTSLARGYNRIASDARSMCIQAGKSSARHRNELMLMKKTARDAAANLSDRKRRSNRSR
jgi:hypothetical protein